MPRRDLGPKRRKALELHLSRMASRDEPVRLERVIEAMEALKRLDTDEYGVCVDCGGRIRLARLLARPEAKRCIDCQARQDEFLAA